MPYALTASAVSQRITRLEEQLGYPLCDRNPFRLKSAGAELLETFRPLLAGFEETVAAQRERQCPVLRIGGPPVFTQSHWPEVLQELRW